MKSRLDRYNDNCEVKQTGSRLAKNKHLYDDLNNKIGFEELVDFNAQTRIELTTLNEPKRSRESYQQLKDYQKLIGNKEIEKASQEQEEEIKVFDINSVLEEARKNRNEIDELEKKRKLKDNEYNVLSDLNKKYLSKDKEKEEDKYEGLEELINTITSKTLAQELEKIEENDDDLFSDLVATSVELQVKAPYENEKIDITGLIDTTRDNEFEDTEENEVDDSFYTRSMDLSEHDFNFDEEDERKSTVKRNILIFVVTIVLLAILAIVGYFVMNYFGFDIKEFF